MCIYLFLGSHTWNHTRPAGSGRVGAEPDVVRRRVVCLEELVRLAAQAPFCIREHDACLGRLNTAAHIPFIGVVVDDAELALFAHLRPPRRTYEGLRRRARATRRRQGIKGRCRPARAFPPRPRGFALVHFNESLRLLRGPRSRALGARRRAPDLNVFGAGFDRRRRRALARRAARPPRGQNRVVRRACGALVRGRRRDRGRDWWRRQWCRAVDIRARR